MGVLEILGTKGPILNSNIQQWNYMQGEETVSILRGTEDVMIPVYNFYKLVAGSNPNYDSVGYSFNHGMATLTIRQIQDGATQYEMFSNEIQKDITLHSYFDGLSYAQLHAIRRYYSLGIAIDSSTHLVVNTVIDGTGKYVKSDLGICPAAGVVLYNFLTQGTEYFPMTEYVLRETKTVSKRSAVAASWTNVNKVDTPPFNSAMNTLIGAIPNQEWLKRSPVVRMSGVNRWQIVTEWWGLPKWSTILYGGTGAP